MTSKSSSDNNKLVQPNRTPTTGTSIDSTCNLNQMTNINSKNDDNYNITHANNNNVIIGMSNDDDSNPSGIITCCNVVTNGGVGHDNTQNPNEGDQYRYDAVAIECCTVSPASTSNITDNHKMPFIPQVARLVDRQGSLSHTMCSDHICTVKDEEIPVTSMAPSQCFYGCEWRSVGDNNSPFGTTERDECLNLDNDNENVTDEYCVTSSDMSDGEASDVVTKVIRGPLYVRLFRFYEKYNPDNIPRVTEFLNAYNGYEDKMFLTLTDKYGPEPVITDAADFQPVEVTYTKSNSTKATVEGKDGVLPTSRDKTQKNKNTVQKSISLDSSCSIIIDNSFHFVGHHSRLPEKVAPIDGRTEINTPYWPTFRGITDRDIVELFINKQTNKKELKKCFLGMLTTHPQHGWNGMIYLSMTPVPTGFDKPFIGHLWSGTLANNKTLMYKKETFRRTILYCTNECQMIELPNPKPRTFLSHSVTTSSMLNNSLKTGQFEASTTSLTHQYLSTSQLYSTTRYSTNNSDGSAPIKYTNKDLAVGCHPLEACSCLSRQQSNIPTRYGKHGRWRLSIYHSERYTYALFRIMYDPDLERMGWGSTETWNTITANCGSIRQIKNDLKSEKPKPLLAPGLWENINITSVSERVSKPLTTDVCDAEAGASTLSTVPGLQEPYGAPSLIGNTRNSLVCTSITRSSAMFSEISAESSVTVSSDFEFQQSHPSNPVQGDIKVQGMTRSDKINKVMSVHHQSSVRNAPKGNTLKQFVRKDTFTPSQYLSSQKRKKSRKDLLEKLRNNISLKKSYHEDFVGGMYASDSASFSAGKSGSCFASPVKHVKYHSFIKSARSKIFAMTHAMYRERYSDRREALCNNENKIMDNYTDDADFVQPRQPIRSHNIRPLKGESGSYHQHTYGDRTGMEYTYLNDTYIDVSSTPALVHHQSQRSAATPHVQNNTSHGDPSHTCVGAPSVLNLFSEIISRLDMIEGRLVTIEASLCKH